jgi:hypothetical protein
MTGFDRWCIIIGSVTLAAGIAGQSSLIAAIGAALLATTLTRKDG